MTMKLEVFVSGTGSSHFEEIAELLDALTTCHYEPADIHTIANDPEVASRDGVEASWFAIVAVPS